MESKNNVINIEKCFSDLTFIDAFLLYKKMIIWIDSRNIDDYKFHWVNTGKYLPDEVSMNAEDLNAFILTFGGMAGDK